MIVSNQGIDYPYIQKTFQTLKAPTTRLKNSCDVSNETLREQSPTAMALIFKFYEGLFRRL